ncbi:hypothetical protein NDU88_010451 [Pleurodeles waltl]|uniref:TIL domain-containing protein n=1 Tax=Pleurodeles waltl TaxID=8319 RepID=A0AAV7PYE0_PLEWA|nr:hypothetical protein NDU88_010451 [Pleurodeles waltl]
MLQKRVSKTRKFGCKMFRPVTYYFDIKESRWSVGIRQKRGAAQSVHNIRREKQGEDNMKLPSSYLQLPMLGLLLIFVNPLLADSTTKGTAKVCPPNSQYGCMRTCRRNCDELNVITPTPCTLICKFGCECIPGYIFRSSNSKECVKYEECPVKCPRNMHYEPCVKSDPATCANPDVKPVGERPCDPWCVCNKGFVYRSDTDRTCVPINECPKRDN